MRGPDGNVICWAGINLDIGRLKQAEGGLREMDRHKDEFLAVLAHELRNPLAPIRHASGLGRRFVDPRRRALRDEEEHGQFQVGVALVHGEVRAVPG